MPLFGLLLAIGCVLLLAPTIVIVGSAFGTTGYLAFPPHGITLRWFGQALTSPAYADGLATSIEVATSVAALALLLGVPAAYALARWDFPGSGVLEAAFLTPLALPAIVLSLALVIASSHAGVVPGMFRVVAAQLLVCQACVIRVMVPAFRRSDRTVEHAARVLGASPASVFFLITLPLVRASVIGAAILSWIISFDDLELALFHASAAAPTLPVVIYSAIVVGVSPVVAATCALLIACAATGTTLWQFMSWRHERHNPDA